MTPTVRLSLNYCIEGSQVDAIAERLAASLEAALAGVR
jgi:hypothetical protein